MQKLILFLKTPEFRKNLMYALLFFLGLFLVVVFSLRIYTRQDTFLSVPDFRGLTEEQAENTAGSDFKLEIGYTYVNDKPRGIVLDQFPHPQDKVKPGRSIYLNVVSTEEPIVKLPDLLQVSKREAEAVLQSYGIKVKELIYKRDEARDMVLEVEYKGKKIEPGTELPKDAEVVLYLGDGFGSEIVVVPDCTGLELSEAQVLIKAFTLLVGDVYYDEDVRNKDKAVVYRLEPAAGDSVEFGTRIDIFMQRD